MPDRSGKLCSVEFRCSRDHSQERPGPPLDRVGHLPYWDPLIELAKLNFGIQGWTGSNTFHMPNIQLLMRAHR